MAAPQFQSPSPSDAVAAAPEKRVMARAGRAFSIKTVFDQSLEDVWEYILPFRKPVGVDTPGQRRGRRAYDGTAIKSAFRFAGRMQKDLLPPFQRWFNLTPGPLIKDEAQKKQVADVLNDTTEIVAAVFNKGGFHTACHEMFLDLVGGTGALLVLEGDDDELVQFIAVPAAEIAIEEDGRGKVKGVYWAKRYEAMDLPDVWPDGTFSEKMQRRIKAAVRTGSSDLIKVTQATVREGKAWRHYCFCEDETKSFATQEFNTCPYITPRFFKVPGEVYGRGPAHLAAPTVASLNKAMELHLRAAAMALVGVWTRTSDLAFNPDMSRLAPGSTIAVARNGGPLGKSLDKLPLPGDFDLSSFVQSDLREAARDLMFDQNLPPDAGAVKSATEIVEKMKRLGEDLFGAYGRLALEIVEPLVVRVLDILASKGVLAEVLTVDRLFIRLDATSPMAAGQNLEDVRRVVDWLQMLLSLGGPEAMNLAADIEKVYRWLADKMGVPSTLVRSEEAVAQMQDQAAQIQAAQAMPPEAPIPETPPAATDGGALPMAA
ncbi:MAG: hypothetical protein RLZZ157_68 [Pseudomonadota bacterium]|jgi:hypothetical protein